MTTRTALMFGWCDPFVSQLRGALVVACSGLESRIRLENGDQSLLNEICSSGLWLAADVVVVHREMGSGFWTLLRACDYKPLIVVSSEEPACRVLADPLLADFNLTPRQCLGEEHLYRVSRPDRPARLGYIGAAIVHQVLTGEDRNQAIARLKETYGLLSQSEIGSGFLE